MEDEYVPLLSCFYLKFEYYYYYYLYLTWIDLRLLSHYFLIRVMRNKYWINLWLIYYCDLFRIYVVYEFDFLFRLLMLCCYFLKIFFLKKFFDLECFSDCMKMMNCINYNQKMTVANLNFHYFYSYFSLLKKKFIKKFIKIVYIK